MCCFVSAAWLGPCLCIQGAVSVLNTWYDAFGAAWEPVVAAGVVCGGSVPVGRSCPRATLPPRLHVDLRLVEAQHAAAVYPVVSINPPDTLL